MGYSSLQACVRDLEKHGKLIRVKEEVDPNLEMAEIHRRIFDAEGPAILFENVKGSPFPALSNLYGTFARTEFIFRKTLAKVQKVIDLKIDPTQALRKPFHYVPAAWTAFTALPRRVSKSMAAVNFGKATIDQLPQVISWPDDGGAFVTLPQVCTLPPHERNPMKANIGMYRIQLSGNDYEFNKEIGLHYQLHRGIGVHHTTYQKSDEPFRASVFIGGPPSHAFSAIMPLPEGLSEMTFAGMLAGRRFRYFWDGGHLVSADADFVITGIVRKNALKPEGPFGDHLGYYSLRHDFPVMDVEQVYYRKNAIWHFTVVGRPPQEDSSFGHLIHQLVKPLAATEFPGVRAINAVDASGVHPLLLVVGSERYMPFREARPEEILAQANHLLGSGQTSLAKYLLIAAGNDYPALSPHRIADFFQHLLERIDWRRDVHFYTETTIDTLDYSGNDWNAGSKVVFACHGPQKRTLSTNIPANFTLPKGYGNAEVLMPGILAFKGTSFTSDTRAEKEIAQLSTSLSPDLVQHFPLLILCDNPKFLSAHLNNFLWATFTRSNPAADIHGIGSFVYQKHWGCTGPLLIDARSKPHHAPGLIPDPEVSKKVDRLFARTGSLASLKL